MVAAQPEVHVVAVESGFRTNDFYALPETRVVVNRPGKDVILVLLHGGAMHWRVETTADTFIADIVRSGKDGVPGKVSLSGIPMVAPEIGNLPVPLNPWGRNFRLVVDHLGDMFGTGRLGSFQGMYQAGSQPVQVDQRGASAIGLERDYLSRFLSGTEDLPPAVRDWKEEAGAPTLAFDTGGVSLTGPEGTRNFPIPGDVPQILLPVASVHDARSHRIFCVTYGDEGFLYSVDTRSGEWDVVTSLDGYDPSAMLYDDQSDSVILTGAFSRPGAIRLIGMDGNHTSLFIPTTGFPGLTDLFNFGNEYGPPLIPRLYRDGWLLLQARSAHSDADRRYGVHIATGEVRLLAYRND